MKLMHMVRLCLLQYHFTLSHRYFQQIYNIWSNNCCSFGLIGLNLSEQRFQEEEREEMLAAYSNRQEERSARYEDIATT